MSLFRDDSDWFEWIAINSMSSLHFVNGTNQIVFNPNQWDTYLESWTRKPLEKMFSWVCDRNTNKLSQRKTITLPRPIAMGVAPDNGMLYCARNRREVHNWVVKIHEFSFENDADDDEASALTLPAGNYFNGQDCTICVCGKYVLVLLAAEGLHIFKRDDLVKVQYVPVYMFAEPEICVEGNIAILWGEFHGVDGLHKFTINQATGHIENCSCLIRKSHFTIPEEFIRICGIWNGKVYVFCPEAEEVKIFDINSGDLLRSISPQQVRNIKGILPINNELYYFSNQYQRGSNRDAMLHRYIL